MSNRFAAPRHARYTPTNNRPDAPQGTPQGRRPAAPKGARSRWQQALCRAPGGLPQRQPRQQPHSAASSPRSRGQRRPPAAPPAPGRPAGCPLGQPQPLQPQAARRPRLRQGQGQQPPRTGKELPPSWRPASPRPLLRGRAAARARGMTRTRRGLVLGGEGTALRVPGPAHRHHCCRCPGHRPKPPCPRGRGVGWGRSRGTAGRAALAAGPAAAPRSCTAAGATCYRGGRPGPPLHLRQRRLPGCRPQAQHARAPGRALSGLPRPPSWRPAAPL